MQNDSEAAQTDEIIESEVIPTRRINDRYKGFLSRRLASVQQLGAEEVAVHAAPAHA